VDQNRKPGVPPTKDISDLKARLGLKRPDGSPAGAPAPGGMPPAGARPTPGQPFPQPGRPGAPAPAAPAARAAAPQPAGMNPYANMRAPQGGFDLRTIDDGAPVQNVGSSRSKTVLIASVIVGAAAFALGGGLGIASVGRANMNTANHAAKAVKGELENMQKTLSAVGTAVAQPTAAGRRQEGHPLLRSAARRRSQGDQAGPPPQHGDDLPRRLLPSPRRGRRQAVQLLLRQHRPL
jgi:hypothetical protein